VKALLLRDLRLAVRAGGGFGLGLVFFLIVVVLVPFGVGPETAILTRIAPGILWVGGRNRQGFGAFRHHGLAADIGCTCVGFFVEPRPASLWFPVAFTASGHPCVVNDRKLWRSADNRAKARGAIALASGSAALCANADFRGRGCATRRGWFGCVDALVDAGRYHCRRSCAAAFRDCGSVTHQSAVRRD